VDGLALQQHQRCCTYTKQQSASSSSRIHAFKLYSKNPASSFNKQDWIKQVALAKHSFLSVAAALSSLPPEVFTTPPMLEPETTLSEEHLQASLNLLQTGWNDLDGYQVAQQESEQVDLRSQTDSSSFSAVNDDDSSSPSTYGEITALGARQLFCYFRQYSSRNFENIDFADLGSGVGKLVVQAFTEIPSLHKATGIELSPSRHASAVETWSKIQDNARKIRNMEEDSLDGASVQLIEGDIFDYDMSSTTHIYVASLCFSEAMMHRLGYKLKQEASELRCIATLKEFPSWFAKEFGKPRVEYIEMTWTRPHGARVFFYSTNRSR
jgi:hypothetical protein